MDKRSADVLVGSKNAKDFIVRKRKPSLPQVFINCLAVLVGALLIAYNVYDRLALASILFILGGGISWYVTVQVQRNRDLAQATEFLNALIASALGMNHKFCVIVGQDGQIVYFDRHFQDMFPSFIEQPNRMLADFLEHASVAAPDREKITRMVEQGGRDKVALEIGNDHQKIALSIAPIPRPSGFVLLRGQDAAA